MATEIRVPTLGESVTEATIGKWFKKVGDTIVADETLGQQRIFAVLCPTAMPPADVRERARAALAATHGRPEAVTSLATGCEETSMLVRKEPTTAR